ncbi:MAG: tetratricopeptide repeat protein [Candidatus Heimdallarchaeaceae archaeon]
MNDAIPPEILVHQNRISPDLREFIVETLEGKFTHEKAKQLGRVFWNILDDPVYERDDELRYLASKIGVMIGQYDLAIKCIEETIPGTVVWGSVALFEIGEVDEALSALQQILENEPSDLTPFIEAIFWICYLKMLIGDTENLDTYKSLLDNTFETRQARLLPKQIYDIKLFIEGMLDLQSASNLIGIRKIEEFLEERKRAKDQYWQLIALLILGEQKLESSDFISSAKIFTQAGILTHNLANKALDAAVNIGKAHVHYLRGELKDGNILSAQTIEKLQGVSQYYLAKALFIRGQILTKLGHHKQARENLNKSYAIAKTYHDYNKGFTALLALADSYLMTNEKEKAQETYAKAYNQVTNIANKRQFTKALVQIAEGDLRQNNFKSALQRINQVETLSEEIQYQKGKADALRLRAQISINKNENVLQQIFILEACQVLYLEIKDEESSANCDILIAEASTKLGKIKEAEKHLNFAKDFYLKIADSLKIAEIKELQAAFDVQMGKFDEALVKLRSSYSHYSDIFDKTKRARCLRKIADILAIKGDFKESISRYRKVKGLLNESENEVESAIIELNKARVKQCLGEYQSAFEDYNLAEQFFVSNSLRDSLKNLKIEKAFYFALTQNEDFFTELLKELKEDFNDQKDAENWLNFVEAVSKLYAGKNEDSYSLLIVTLQNSLSQQNLLTIGILFTLIKNTLALNREHLTETYVSEEMQNYIGLIQGITTESNFFYLKGALFLVELLWNYMIQGERDYNEIIVQASEYFASTGIEIFANKLLNLQYNISLWSGQEEVSIQSIFGSPKKYESPESALIELVDDIVKSLFIENLLRTEKSILQNLLKIKEEENK